jgi:hypothetical protein
MTGIPAIDSASPPAPRIRRHALGLPAGSVRALLAFMVLGVLWLLALYGMTPNGQIPVAFVYLQYVMILILAHFFAAHGNTIGPHVSTSSPLGLPAGSVRFILLAGYVGLIVWLFYDRREFAPVPEGHLFLPLILMSGFLLGFVVMKVVMLGAKDGQPPYWFQDVQAWFALLAVIGLVVIALVYLVIRPSLPESMQFDMSKIETVVSAIVGFYFGARS